MPYLTPDTIPNTRYCRRLYIPNDERIIGAVNGALATLGIESNWELFGVVTPQEIALAMRIMFEEYAAGDVCMIGAVFPIIRINVPPNCLLCDGSTHDRADWPELYDLLPPGLQISPTQFNTPTIQNVVVVAYGDQFPIFSMGGARTVSLTAAQNGAHTHSESVVGTTLGVVGEIPALVPTGAAGTTGSSGTGAPHENMPPYVSLPYVIVGK